MAKGKKFNAAEKHFEKEKQEWIRKIKELERENFLLRRENLFMSNLMDVVSKDCNDTFDKCEEIMKIKDMNNNDIQILIKARKSQLDALSLFKSMKKYF